MTQIKIKSNPYNREISYQTFDAATEDWIDIKQSDEKSRLRETDSERFFYLLRLRKFLALLSKNTMSEEKKYNYYLKELRTSMLK
ncbi:hypothetical protein HMPREF3103_01045 [Granulicatella sp. HMSC30F09]|uniref:hypothetical protein n=1 Tax=Granulicatella sp. HMSC30F09 TaxID=1581071 RepID=UPI0008A1F177|nr:hypothetical protein [Granulicatella sp. HMSC30F09]OFT81399.1 hypothetical protein HMPREF3103_01045 [Granulicatella sp. HMSC30F09]